MNARETKKIAMYERIEKHGADLNAIFHTGIDNVKLCKKLRRLETEAHQLAEDYCNGVVDSQESGTQEAAILDKVDKILKATDEQANAIIFNADARGYALKIDDEYICAHGLKIHKDWGGYGIIAPDLSEGK